MSNMHNRPRALLPHRRMNRFWLNAGHTDVMATVRVNSRPVEIVETEVVKTKEWQISGELDAEKGDEFSIELRDDRYMHHAGVHLACIIDGKLVASESYDREHQRLQASTLSARRSFIFDGEPDERFKVAQNAVAMVVTVALYSIHGGAKDTESGRIENGNWNFLYPRKPALYSFTFKIHCHDSLPKRIPFSPVKSTTRKRKRSNKRRSKRRAREESFVVSDDDEIEAEAGGNSSDEYRPAKKPKKPAKKKTGSAKKSKGKEPKKNSKGASKFHGKAQKETVDLDYSTSGVSSRLSSLDSGPEMVDTEHHEVQRKALEDPRNVVGAGRSPQAGPVPQSRDLAQELFGDGDD